MKFFVPDPAAAPLPRPLLALRIPAGFPSPAADHVETRMDLNALLVKNPSHTFYAHAEGDSMFPAIQDGSLMVIDRYVDQPSGCVVLASVNNDFCVKRLYRFPDGSIELRPDNPRHESIFLPSEYEGEFDIFGRVTWSCTNLTL